MNVQDILQALDDELNETHWFGDHAPLTTGEQDFLHDYNKHRIIALLEAGNLLDFKDALESIAYEMQGKNVSNIVNEIVEAKYRTNVIHRQLRTSISRIPPATFNTVTLEALTLTGFLLPLHAINYCVCFRQISALPKLLYAYPDAAIDVFTLDTLKFNLEIVPSFTEVFIKHPERYFDLFAFLPSPQSMYAELYANLLKYCLRIDKEKTLLLLERLNDIPNEYLTVIADQLIGDSSISDVINETPAHHKPFVLKLISSRL